MRLQWVSFIHEVPCSAPVSLTAQCIRMSMRSYIVVDVCWEFEIRSWIIFAKNMALIFQHYIADYQLVCVCACAYVYAASNPIYKNVIYHFCKFYLMQRTPKHGLICVLFIFLFTGASQ